MGEANKKCNYQRKWNNFSLAGKYESYCRLTAVKHCLKHKITGPLAQCLQQKAITLESFKVKLNFITHEQ